MHGARDELCRQKTLKRKLRCALQLQAAQGQHAAAEAQHPALLYQLQQQGIRQGRVTSWLTQPQVAMFQIE